MPRTHRLDDAGDLVHSRGAVAPGVEGPGQEGAGDGRAAEPPGTEARPLHTGRAIAGAALGTLALIVVADLDDPVGSEEDRLDLQARLIGTLSDQDGVAGVAPVAVSDDERTFVFRSILVPILHPERVISFAPIIITGVPFGLAMDYQLFLVTGMREAHVHGQPARTAVVTGLRHGRVVVIAAAVIMAAVFGGFVFSHLSMVRSFGLGLAVGVLFDAFAVRLLIVPSVMHLLGEKAWWIPRWLDRIPCVDVEGSALERTHPVLPRD